MVIKVVCELTKNNEEFCEAAKVGYNDLPAREGGSIRESRLTFLESETF